MHSKKIVITRPYEQGYVFAEQICDDGSGVSMSDFLFEPLIKINLLAVMLPDLDSYDGVIVTSVHGIHIVPHADIHADIYCVGQASSALLQNKGAEPPLLIKPTADGLVQAMIKCHRGRALRFLYIRGKDISFDIKGALEGAGHNVDELVVYEAVASNDFSSDLIEAVKAGNLSAITFFSKRSADIFIRLAEKAEITDALKELKALCISQAMVECLHSVFGGNIKVSTSPDARSMAQMVRHYIDLNK